MYFCVVNNWNVGDVFIVFLCVGIESVCDLSNGINIEIIFMGVRLIFFRRI